MHMLALLLILILTLALSTNTTYCSLIFGICNSDFQTKTFTNYLLLYVLSGELHNFSTTHALQSGFRAMQVRRPWVPRM